MRAAPKLTNSHIHPTNFEKMKVKFATQVLSGTVASGMNLYIRFGAIPEAASATSAFIERSDKLFDLLNSSNTGKAKKYNRAFRGEQYQIDFLNECFNFFDNLKIIDNAGKNITNRMKFINGMKITISGLKFLWNSVLSAIYKFVFTRRFNQDALENLNGAIRQQNGNCINPTAIQFQRSFKKLVCLKLFHSGTENCEGDSDEILLSLNNLSIAKHEEPSVIEQSSSPIILEQDYQKNDILEKNFETYVYGYLLKKCLKIHSCSDCEIYAHNIENIKSEDLILFTKMKAYRTDEENPTGKLIVPPIEFINFVCKLKELFETKFEDICTSEGIIEQLLTLAKCFPLDHPCIDFPRLYLIRLYFRLRIFFTLKNINRNFKSINRNKIIIWKNQ